MEESTPTQSAGPSGTGPSDLGSDADLEVNTELDGRTPSRTPTNSNSTVKVKPDDLVLGPGTMLGDYQIEGKLGEGGWASVYAAVHPLIGKPVAVKVLKPELCRTPAAVQRFVDEARAVNQIGHPNIVDIFAFGEMLDGRSYFVMERLKGETLWQRICRGPMSLKAICAIVTPLARALQAAHHHGIIHRDLKPANIFLVDVPGEQPHVKLLDFGIAKLAGPDGRADWTSSGEIVGTPRYMAPEQARGRSIDHRVDIYALGGIIFELLTGRPPFLGDNAADLIASLMTETPPRPSSCSSNVPPELDDLVTAMLAKGPSDRPSLGEVCAAIDQVHDAMASGSTRAVTVRVRPPAAPRWLLVGGVIAAAAGGVVGYALIGADGSNQAEPATSSSDATQRAVEPRVAVEPVRSATSDDRQTEPAPNKPADKVVEKPIKQHTPAQPAAREAASPERLYIQNATRAINGHVEHLLACFNANEAAAAEMQIKVAIVIGANGRAKQVSFVPGTVDGSPLGACLRAELTRVDYPSSEHDQKFSIPLRAKTSR